MRGFCRWLGAHITAETKNFGDVIKRANITIN
jgi:hypothetical protein